MVPANNRTYVFKLCQSLDQQRQGEYRTPCLAQASGHRVFVDVGCAFKEVKVSVLCYVPGNSDYIFDESKDALKECRGQEEYRNMLLEVIRSKVMKFTLTTTIVTLVATILMSTTTALCTDPLIRDLPFIKTLAQTQNFKDVPVH
ncbi:hypothetical protein EC957_011999 [Mortierella hygrophila]|uniref:Uncharacterized protein n=1 Tax=Mortierella hygrophila TaxID=979708 RepID=A0A9P6FI20_9FUNG|nr:hypothetical protein EC957_011999 [Mortierella hygrophila]